MLIHFWNAKKYSLVSRKVYFHVFMFPCYSGLYTGCYFYVFLLWVFVSNWCWFRFEITIYRVVIRKYIFMFSCFHVTSFGYKLVTQPHFINLGKQGLNIFMHLEKTWKHENMKICLSIWNVIMKISWSQTLKGGRHIEIPT